MVETIATIGHLTPDIAQFMDYLISCNIKSFRFNLSKFSDLSKLENYIDGLIAVKKRYGTYIKIMLDIPYPYQKCRLYTDNILELKAGTIFRIFNGEKIKNNHQIVSIKTNAIDFGNYVKDEDRIVCGDGRHAFIVKNVIDSNNIEVQLANDTVIYPGKAIHIKHFAMEGNLNPSITEKICILRPDSIALSFVSSESSVKKARDMFEGSNIISKIETEDGINNINRLSEVSDIMIARGDLLLNTPYEQFLNNQKMIADTVHEKKKKLYIATGILSSLSTSFVPTQSEIVDLLELKGLAPKALILNYGLITGNLKEALNIINLVFKKRC
ncbi:MAG: hypothetical protein HFE65_04150 [Clostridiales bacterium]|nr:hypothetical protein [Clostridiales bacterium]